MRSNQSCAGTWAYPGEVAMPAAAMCIRRKYVRHTGKRFLQSGASQWNAATVFTICPHEHHAEPHSVSYSRHRASRMRV
jgi:hypothetical protein